MRYVVVDVPADRGGGLSILQDFHRYVSEHEQQHEWIFIVSTPELSSSSHVSVVRKPWIRKSLLHRLLWDYIVAGYQIRKLKPDAVFSLQNVPVPFTSVPNVVYVHQSLPFQDRKHYSFLKRSERGMAFYQHIIGRLIRQGARHAGHVIVQSAWMKRAMLDRANVHERKIAVVAPLVNLPELKQHIFQPGEAVRIHSFFYPAGASDYKNHRCILEAARILYSRGINDFTIDFTISAADNELAAQLAAEMEEFNGHIRCVGLLPRDEVYERLTRSVLLFPSYIETVGLPLLEARQIGSVILASDCHFSQENLAGYPNARLFNPLDAAALADEMEAVIRGAWVYTSPETEALTSEDQAAARGWKPVVKLLQQCAMYHE